MSTATQERAVLDGAATASPPEDIADQGFYGWIRGLWRGTKNVVVRAAKGTGNLLKRFGGWLGKNKIMRGIGNTIKRGWNWARPARSFIAKTFRVVVKSPLTYVATVAAGLIFGSPIVTSLVILALAALIAMIIVGMVKLMKTTPEELRAKVDNHASTDNVKSAVDDLVEETRATAEKLETEHATLIREQKEADAKEAAAMLAAKQARQKLADAEAAKQAVEENLKSDPKGPLVTADPDEQLSPYETLERRHTYLVTKLKAQAESIEPEDLDHDVISELTGRIELIKVRAGHSPLSKKAASASTVHRNLRAFLEKGIEDETDPHTTWRAHTEWRWDRMSRAITSEDARIKRVAELKKHADTSAAVSAK